MLILRLRKLRSNGLSRCQTRCSGNAKTAGLDKAKPRCFCVSRIERILFGAHCQRRSEIQLFGEVAAGPMARFHLLQGWSCRPAHVLGMWAAGMEVTAAGRISRDWLPHQSSPLCSCYEAVGQAPAPKPEARKCMGAWGCGRSRRFRPPRPADQRT